MCKVCAKPGRGFDFKLKFSNFIFAQNSTFLTEHKHEIICLPKLYVFCALNRKYYTQKIDLKRKKD